MAISPYIYGIHDPGGESHMGSSKGWIVLTEVIGTSGTGGKDYSSWSDQGYGVIVRLNNAYGSAGTLPLESRYGEFAARCASFVQGSSGVDYWIIGNETNLPREWPTETNGDPQPITVARYTSCYLQCHEAIRQVSQDARICPSPSGTWAPPYPDQGIEGFLDYWNNCLDSIGAEHIDGLIIHAYTHGCEKELVTSDATMDPPYDSVYYHFRVYKNYMEAVPQSMATKHVFITECNQNFECATGSNPKDAWSNNNNEWVRAVYAEIDSWNQENAQKICCVALFRWVRETEGDLTYGIEDKDQIIADFEAAVAFGYRWSSDAGVPYEAQHTGGSAPTSMQPGQGATVNVRFTNTGTETWTKAKGVKMGSQDPPDNTTWGPNRIELSDNDIIAPGASKTFAFWIHAPQTIGSYNFQWGMLVESGSVTWFDHFSDNIVIRVGPPYAAQFIQQSGPPETMQPGQTATVSFTFKNTGADTWTQASAIKLGSQHPQDNTIWGKNRVELSDTDAIPTGASKTFTFEIRAPTTTGDYNFQWRMLRELVMWFGDLSTNVLVRVQGTPYAAQFVNQLVPASMQPNQMVIVTITFKNTGTTTWTKAAGVMLGSQNPEDNTTWGMKRVNLSDTDAIAPGASVTFRFKIRAPVRNATYNFQWRMVLESDSAAWFGDLSKNVGIVVSVDGETNT